MFFPQNDCNDSWPLDGSRDQAENGLFATTLSDGLYNSTEQTDQVNIWMSFMRTCMYVITKLWITCTLHSDRSNWTWTTNLLLVIVQDSTEVSPPRSRAHGLLKVWNSMQKIICGAQGHVVDEQVYKLFINKEQYISVRAYTTAIKF